MEIIKYNRKIGIIISVSLHVVAILQFIFQFNLLNLPMEWLYEALCLMVLSLIFSIIVFYVYENKEITFILFLLRFTLILIISYPLGDHLNIRLIFLTSLVFEIIIYTDKTDILFPIAIVLLSLFLPTDVYVWSIKIKKLSVSNKMYACTYIVIIIILTKLLKYYQRTMLYYRHYIDQFKRTSSSLAKTNLRLQDYIILEESKIVNDERKRLTRDIHDIIGHTLISIILSMKAAIRLAGNKNERLNEFILQAKEQAQNGLNEMRRSLEILKLSKPVELTLVMGINKLVKAFEKTHIKITVRYGEFPYNFNEKVNSILYRIVQEGITNAIYHGNAYLINISLSYNNDIIKVSVSDNGNSCKKIIPGLGLQGIKERIKEYNGYIETHNAYSGFTLRVSIPFKMKG